jgi:hypothetical protein
MVPCPFSEAADRIVASGRHCAGLVGLPLRICAPHSSPQPCKSWYRERHWELAALSLSRGLRSRVADPVGFERQANEHLEEHLLIGPSPQLEEAGIADYEPLSHLEVGERYAETKKQNLREQGRALGATRAGAGTHRPPSADRRGDVPRRSQYRPVDRRGPIGDGRIRREGAVVTENVWTDAVGRSKLDERFGTVVISRLEDLTRHLLY